ncbi:MAG: sulfurtransferase [Gammaproteobacteria bacterium]|nr:sulfurtransferase [Gammaproteobacteria bacterium]MCP5138696.1 sulfurtransferase [Chromatiales bacterium]
MLVSIDDLAADLSNPDLVVVDCRFNLQQPAAGSRLYAERHIPGAYYADLDRDLAGPRTAETGRHPLPDVEDLQQLLSGFGIGPETRVVVYDEGGGALAARLWWLLRWLGHTEVSLLDGGFAAWCAAGLPISTEVPARRKGRFVARPGSMPVATTRNIEAALGTARILLLDLRSHDRYLGRVEPIDPVAGHVPGAVSAPFSRNLGPDGRFLPAAELRRNYSAMIGDRPVAEVVCMCGSGVTACHGIFALELAGWPGAGLYVGSWSEWIRSAGRPVERES